MSAAKIGFTRKKVQSLTLGEKLKKLREKRRVSLPEAAKQTKIQAKYLMYLEEGTYEKLPADVYVRGFLGAYAQCLGIARKPLVKMYERERGIHETIARDDVPEQEVKNLLQPKRFIITPKIMIAVAGSIGFIAVALFLYGELDRFISSPWLVVDAPVDGATIEGTMVTIAGTTDPQARVFINEEAVLVGADGMFTEDINIVSGANTITIRSKNSFDKESVQTRTIYGPEQQNVQPDEAQTEGEQFSGVRAAMRIGAVRVWISVVVDGEKVYSKTVDPETEEVFDGAESVEITAGIGNQVFITVNGDEEIVLSEEGGLVSRVFEKTVVENDESENDDENRENVIEEEVGIDAEGETGEENTANEG